MDNPSCNPEIWGGIECTINRVRDQFFDQLEFSGHYSRPEDLEHLASLGICKIRYPLLWEKHQPKEDSIIDWSWAEEQLSFLKKKNIDVIAGLVHHGSGPSFTSLTDPRFPELLASYAGTVARKFPWINYYTPVNEPLTTARFSGLYGLWYPHHRNNRSFMIMLLHELKGIALSMKEIRKVNPSAKLVQTEDLGKTYSTPLLRYQANFENERRWLTYDILCGRFGPKHKLWKFFRKYKIPDELFQFFLDNPCPPDIFGFNHYLTSERYLDEKLALYPEHTYGGNGKHRYADVEAVRVETEEETGIEILLKEAWERYRKPLAITEVHLHCHREEQLRWFRHIWQAGKKLRNKGVDILAITSWALIGSFGWNRLLTEPAGEYEPGAFDIRSGKLRHTALAQFIRETINRNECEHHLTTDKGWWQRSTRLIYGNSATPVQLTYSMQRPVLIIGKNGTLGRAFARACEERCLNYRLLSRNDCDISDPASIENAIGHYRPWGIINAAGFVRVDDAEREKTACLRDNAIGARNLAVACNSFGIRLMSFSSDLVFDGKKKQPYLETDPVQPLNTYGESKAESEKLLAAFCPAALVIRTSAFFGPWDEFNFAHYVRRSLSQYESIQVAGDLTISPTYVPHLVHNSLDLFIDGERGIWHLANKGSVSWAQFAEIIADRFDLDRSLIIHLPSTAMNYDAPRPAYSVLGSLHGQILPSLEQALDDYFHKVVNEKRKVA